jgi:putative lipoprotein
LNGAVSALRAAAAVVLLLAGCAATTGSDGLAVLQGSVAYRERIALPADAIIEVRLLDRAQDAAQPDIAATRIETAGRQVPIPFELRYDPRWIKPGRHYGVLATIRNVAGRVLFSSDAAQPLPAAGARLDLRLVRAAAPAGP